MSAFRARIKPSRRWVMTGWVALAMVGEAGLAGADEAEPAGAGAGQAEPAGVADRGPAAGVFVVGRDVADAGVRRRSGHSPDHAGAVGHPDRD